ncbi:DUF308 domain-containing protein [Corynebacterium anserum]|uniref:DUF308 domain-containing protein n=1 Tax=Corynebacterium anserum TaxID=2684406 RepID=A0A7G7YNN4_9CORY|nr:DUF308 domain-containing protein [Corynebacterium anserum]MBC2681687.1 DUF308 domain-containing protein [Corynebacterium anserum]QNH96104.1 DUF308 domain-containing protein [Corynebacterium anserum]
MEPMKDYTDQRRASKAASQKMPPRGREQACESAASPRFATARKPLSRLSLVSLLFGILSIPATLLPFYGIIAAMISIMVGIIALVRAHRNDTPRGYALGGLALSILAMGVAIFFTSAAVKATEGCETLRGDELRACVEEKK